MENGEQTIKICALYLAHTCTALNVWKTNGFYCAQGLPNLLTFTTTLLLLLLVVCT